MISTSMPAKIAYADWYGTWQPNSENQEVKLAHLPYHLAKNTRKHVDNLHYQCQ